ncbi:META domain-containing protein, partial [Hyphomonas sp.]|uniref:META domain-containing protein n=1 Tax=Hyphomonas sp. TaxID=87 RepID=UPI00391A817D
DNMTGMPHPFTVTVNYGDRVFQGCGGEPVSLLAGDEWMVEEINNAALVEGSRVTINFNADAGEAGGRSGCNSYGAPFTLTGESLTFGPIVSTQMACEDPLMRQENALHKALGDVTGFQITDDGALLLTASERGHIKARR